MDTPPPPPVAPLDPLTAEAEKRSQNELIAGLQTQARGDMGSLMAAYGKLAMAMGTSPTSVVGASKAVA